MSELLRAAVRCSATTAAAIAAGAGHSDSSSVAAVVAVCVRCRASKGLLWRVRVALVEYTKRATLATLKGLLGIRRASGGEQ
jgi:hypothetical protein